MLQEAFFTFPDGTIRIMEARQMWAIWLKGEEHNLSFSKINRETLTWFIGVCTGCYFLRQVFAVLNEERTKYLREVFKHKWGQKMDDALIHCLNENSHEGYLLDQYILMTK
jgi:hypothetical protein